MSVDTRLERTPVVDDLAEGRNKYPDVRGACQHSIEKLSEAGAIVQTWTGSEFLLCR